MVNKNADRMIALLPFFLVFLAAFIGMKSEINLFSLCDLKTSLYQQSIFNSSSDRAKRGGRANREAWAAPNRSPRGGLSSNGGKANR